MDNARSDIKPDFLPDLDENVALMEPLVLSSSYENRSALVDLCFTLVAKSAALKSSLPNGILIALSELVRKMNCYYSNLIEGHDTHPVDIERAMCNDYSNDKKKRDLQVEAKAHVAVQAWIDQGFLANKAFTIEGILEVHRRFCENMPEDLLSVEDPVTHEKVAVEPGKFRAKIVQVGKHVAISPGAVARFLKRYEDVYAGLGKSEMVLASAAAHHRLLWIHPFIDGNGRVARLISYANFLDTLDTGGVWSVARGLARTVDEYKRHLMNCDQPRQGDLDGRGSRSEKALGDFTEYYLKMCLDQVAFMESLVQPDRLRARILYWADEESKRGDLSPNSGALLEAILYRGELPRADIPGILNLGDRQARRVVSGLVARGVLTTNGDRAPYRLGFPAAVAPRWMPGLFPDSPS